MHLPQSMLPDLQSKPQHIQALEQGRSLQMPGQHFTHTGQYSQLGISHPLNQKPDNIYKCQRNVKQRVSNKNI